MDDKRNPSELKKRAPKGSDHHDEAPKGGYPPEQWIPFRPSDSSEYLEGDLPTYADGKGLFDD